MFALSRRPPDDSQIGRTFEHCRRAHRAAFIPYLMAGDPDLETTAKLLDALVAGNADIIELGVPFSDPVADGPVNQRSAYRSLDSGTTLSGIFELVARFRRRSDVPIVLFSYFNPIHARGVEAFADQAAASGVDGVLPVDLPAEEGVSELAPCLAERGLDTVFLLAPTSTRERVRKVGEASRGFVYYVSRTGVTGERDELPADLLRDVRQLRRRLRLPVAVGFGISKPEHVAAVAKVADGVVVGSALVRLIEEHGQDRELPSLLEAKARELTAPLRS